MEMQDKDTPTSASPLLHHARLRSRSRNRRSRIWKRIPGAEKVVNAMTKGDTKSSNRDYRRDSTSDMEANPLTNTESSPTPEADRTIYLNRPPPPGEAPVKFKSNQISTAKYSVITFLPKFLYEQFRRVANCFFLLIGLLQQIPGISPTGRWVTLIPFLMIEFVTALKEIFEDLLRHRQDDKTNNAPAFVYSHEQRTFVKKGWKEVCVGDFVKVQDGAYFPADLVILSSTKEQGMCYIETASLDGETNLKVRSAISQTSGLTDEKDLANFVGKIKCEEPNRHIYTFNGNMEIQSENNQVFPLSPSVILLRGAKLMNTGHIFGVVVYTGHDSKLLMNYKKAPSKRSNMDKITNNHIYFLFATLITIALGSTAFSEAQKSDGEDHDYIDTADTAVPNFFMNFLTFFILYNNLIPISLQVTLDFVKFLQAYFVNWDQEMYYAPTDTYALARTSNLNEDLGQIKYIFSDKTGTLTQNIMEYIKATIAGNVYAINQDSNDEYDSQLLTDLRNRSDAVKQDDLRDFLLCMAVCHTVIPEFDEKTKELKSYNASSPDERALVEGAARYGFKFIDKGPHSTIIEVPGGEKEEYEVLNVIEFTSARKRMSVIVKCPNGAIKLFIKGADNMILERIGHNKEQRVYYDTTLKCLDEFAGEGLRTLCLAMKVIPPAEYTTWAAKYHAASIAITNREEQLDEVATIMEQDLTLLGASAIEDKLQDGVPETIHQCLEANIKVWVLTGDKQETAINIGHSSRLLDHNSDIILINTDNLEDTRNEVTQQLNKLNTLSNKVEAQNKSLVVDGPSLTFALDEGLKKDFLDLLKRCRSVICCRVSPMQKAEVVGLVKQSSKSDLTLAIGDGANDVAMIQKAHIGVGINGNEGLQAANSSDFAIAQFRFLQRLLFVHGAWFYARNAKVIVYSFYKNICLYIIELWFAIYSYWTGQVLFERWSIGSYNILFTLFPPLCIGLFDQSCSAFSRMNIPSLYRETQKGVFFNNKVFWKWIFNAILHSIILFWLPMKAYESGTVWENGKSGDYLGLGNTVYSCVILTVCLKAGMETNAWNWIIHLSIWGSIVLWFLYLTLTSFFWPTLPFFPDMTGMIGMLTGSLFFWMCLIMVPFCTLIPDITLQSLTLTIKPSPTDQVRLKEHGKAPVIDRIYKPTSPKGSSMVKAKNSNDNIEMGTQV